MQLNIVNHGKVPDYYTWRSSETTPQLTTYPGCHGTTIWWDFFSRNILCLHCPCGPVCVVRNYLTLHYDGNFFVSLVISSHKMNWWRVENGGSFEIQPRPEIETQWASHFRSLTLMLFAIDFSFNIFWFDTVSVHKVLSKEYWTDSFIR